MTGLVDIAGLAIVALWATFRLLRLIAIRENALPVAFALVLIVIVAWLSNPVFAATVSVLTPFGVLLPALCLRSITRSLGVRVTPFHWAELLAFLILYGLFLAASAGLLDFDPYRYGYTLYGAVGIALVLCLLGFLTDSLFLPLVALVSLLLWTFSLGSSNVFDNVTHVFLLPAALIALPVAILRR
jgi:hypothetical protein